MKTKITFSFLVLLIFYQQALGQSIAPDSALVVSSVALLEKQYAASFTVHPQLFNGPEYLDYSKRYFRNTGHQFLSSTDKQKGSIYYNQQLFPDLRFNYDVVLDQLVLQHATSPLTLRLVNENVRYFSIAGRRFFRLVADSVSGEIVRTGYYEILVDSTVQLLAKRAKRLQENEGQGKINAEYILMDRLFIKKDGLYYPINRKKSVTRLFSNRSSEIQKYIQANKLRFNKASREADSVLLTRYYNSLIPQ
jgi:hypothetical protein